jgi:hypothetical protein
VWGEEEEVLGKVEEVGGSWDRESGQRRKEGGRLVYGWFFQTKLRCEAE